MGGFSVDANRLFFVYKSLLLKVELEGHDFGIMAYFHSAYCNGE